MNSTTKFRPLRGLCTLATLTASLLLSGFPVSGQTILNPSFEANSFTVNPGYISGNTAITDWAATPTNRIGLNPASGNPFANNGIVPDGLNVAFLQSNPPAGDVFLESDITGLTIGTKYKVTFRINGRSNQVPWLKVWTHAVGDASRTPTSTPVGMRVNRVSTAIGTGAYKYAAYEFTATDTSQTLTLNNYTTVNDHTVLVDNFTIAPAGGWSYDGWTSDATSGVDSTYGYTHAFTFGGANLYTLVNGVTYTPARGANPSYPGTLTGDANPAAPGAFTSSGFPTAFGVVGRTITGSSNLIGNSFAYGGLMNIVINGLQPSTSYVATVYGVGFDAQPPVAATPYARSATFSSSLAPDDRLTVDLDQYNQGNGIRVIYSYTTGPADTSVTLSYTATGDGTFHTSGFSNRGTTPITPPVPGPQPWSYAAWNGNATSGVNSDAVYTHAYNFGDANNPVVNGVTFTGVATANPAAANFSTANFGSLYNANDVNNVTGAGGSEDLANNFVYNGFAGRLNLTGLVPGKEYLLSLFSVAWDGAGARQAVFSGPDGFLQMDQDAFGDNNGIRFDYRYIANAAGTLTVTTSPVQDASIHLYGFCNREYFFIPHLEILSHPEDTYITAVGAPATFTVIGSGAAPLTYQWRKGVVPVDIPGETNATLTIPSVSASDVDVYSVVVGGSGQGTVTSNNARLVLIPDRVPGLFDTGMGNNCAVLPDGTNDPHYVLTTNPDGDSFIQAVVHDASTFPLSWIPPAAGPWLQNTATSKWIAPRFNTVASPGEGVDAGAGLGVYVYETTFDLTGFDLNTVRITGGWATDNLGVKIRVNGLETGLTNSAQFPVLTNFTIADPALFVAGLNTLEFFVQNQTVTPGYTGLRVQGLQGFGNVVPATAPYIAVNPVNTVLQRNVSSCLAVQASGSATLTYQWYKVTPGGPFLIPGATSSTLTGTVTTPAEAAQISGDYYCVVSNGVGTPATSDTATVTVFNNLPTLNADGLATSMNTAATISVATLTANDTDADLDTLTVTSVSASTTQGGTASLSLGVVTYTPATGFTGNDSFTYSVDDGWGGTASETVQVEVLSGPVPALEEFIYSSTATTQDFLFLGVSGRSYHFERSTDLVIWQELDLQTAPVTGIIQFQDASPPTGRAQYRISWTP